MPKTALQECCQSAARIAAVATLCLSVPALQGCGEIWNNPYAAASPLDNTLYTSFSERPKHLDPAKSYTEDEAAFNAQIYEPPFQYHYFKRPYELVTGTALALPKPRYLDAAGAALPADATASAITSSVYEIRIRPDIRYQPHPAFVAANRQVSREAIARKFSMADFGATGSRLLTAADYVYQIKRLAHPRVNSPIFGHMADYIVGLKEYGASLKEAQKKLDGPEGRETWMDLRGFEIAGVRVIDAATFEITVKGKYPQFLYWMAMPFFAPIPWEVDQFYSQAGMRERNFTLDWYPLGTGPYMLTENNPNARMVLSRNPHFRGEPYPSEGEPGDREAGLLADAGKIMPFIDRVVFTREKETIPYWNKFLQGYYDRSGIDSDNFDQAVRSGVEGEAGLTPEMEARGIRLRTSTATSSSFLAFNWLDPVVGGADPKNAERARKIRQAITIAIDIDEFISIFRNGRGIAAQGPLPPGIFGFKEGNASINPIAYEITEGKAVRRPIAEAKRLLAEAGFPAGRDASSGRPLVLALDVRDGGPSDKARLDWYRKQFAKIDIQLDVRGTDWNRLQEKVRKGNTQMFFMGWNADYPDPENFLFMLYGPNSVAKSGGENRANYENPAFDALFEKLKAMDNGPQRLAAIEAAVKVLHVDAPWAWGFHPKSYGLAHAWIGNSKPNEMARNGIKYQRIDSELRARMRAQWNRALMWPFALLLIAVAVLAWLGLRYWRRAEAAVALARVKHA